MRIANPIYDVVFKYLMQDNEAAILILSTLLEVDEEDYPDEYRKIVRRLNSAVSEPKIRKTMEVEDEILAEFEDIERRIAGMEKTIEEKDQVTTYHLVAGPCRVE